MLKIGDKVRLFGSVIKDKSHYFNTIYNRNPATKEWNYEVTKVSECYNKTKNTTENLYSFRGIQSQGNFVPTIALYESEISESGLQYFIILNGEQNISNDVTKKSCTHKWIQYVGLTQVYKYCEGCDVKQYE